MRDALATATGDESLIVHTQIARTHGLRQDLDTACRVLLAVELQVASAGAEARARNHLELARHAEALALQLALEREADGAGRPDP